MTQFEEMLGKVEEAKNYIRLSDRLTERMASFLVGRLRNVSWTTLKYLKRELQDFNSNTGQWKRKE